MKMINTKRNTIIVFFIIVVLIVIWCAFSVSKSGAIKIGVVTDLTGNNAYWGEATKAGMNLAKLNLEKEGINTDFILENGQTDSKQALSAAQKLVNIDNVNAIYSEFGPMTNAINSFVKDKSLIHLYSSASVSLLKDNPNAYKTFIDYQDSCTRMAEYFHTSGISKIGLLKANVEFGDLCLAGVRSIYPDSQITVEGFNIGETDFKTHLLKLKEVGVKGIITATYAKELFLTLKEVSNQKMLLPIAMYASLVSKDLLDNPALLVDTYVFSSGKVSTDFISQIKDNFPKLNLTDYYPAALAYTHLFQLGKYFSLCGRDIVCVKKQLDQSKSESSVGFNGFKDRIAQFDTLIQRWDGEKYSGIFNYGQ